MASKDKDGDQIQGDQNKLIFNAPVQGGTIVVGSGNIVNVGAPGAGTPTLAEVRARIAEMLTLAAAVEGSLRLTVEGTLRTSAEELEKPRPGLEAALNNLKLLLGVLPAAAAASEAVQKLRPLVEQAVHWLQQLVR